MVQIVFVHGVANRSSPEQDLWERNRDRLLKAAVFGEHCQIRSPRWGDLVPPLTFDGASFAKQGVQALNLAGVVPPAGLAAEANPALTDIAAKDPVSLVDMLFAEQVSLARHDGDDLSDAEVRQFAAAAQMLSNGSVPDPSALASATDDQDVVTRTQKLIGGAASLSIGGRLRDAATSLAGRVRNVASRGVFGAVEGRNEDVARFLGDIFVYLREGATREAIRSTVRASLIDAWNDRRGDEPLIAMGHSLGGVILCDMLGDVAAADLPADLRVDALVTVGSQPGLFSEMGLISGSAGVRVSTQRPEAIRHWLNVFDPIDVFGFRTTPMFEGSEDFAFSSATGLISAHSAYFDRPQFYGRLRTRLVAAQVLA